MNKLPLKSIEAKRGIRPDGYYEDVVSRGKIEGDMLLISNAELIALRRKYSPSEVVSTDMGTCATCSQKASKNPLEGIQEQIRSITRNSRASGSVPNPEEHKAYLEKKQSWLSVKGTWEKAASFLESAKSRGSIATLKDVLSIESSKGNRVDEATYAQRRLSCFGDKTKGIGECPSLKRKNGMTFCGACGCGQNKLAELNEVDDKYNKLHYPYLECPLKREGFSNAAKSEGNSN